MKTSILYLFITLLLFNPFEGSAKTLEKTNLRVPQSELNQPDPISPFESNNFQEWASIQTDHNVWRYANDKNYRTLVNNWNLINNSSWAESICASNPFGTFDFSGGLKHANEVIVNDQSQNTVYGFNTTSDRVIQAKILGSPTYGKLKTEETTSPTISLASLPTLGSKTLTNPHVTETLDFTKHVTIVPSSWRQNKGFNANKYSSRYDSVSDKWSRTSGTVNYSSMTNQAYYEQNNTSSPVNSISNRNYTTKSFNSTAPPVSNTSNQPAKTVAPSMPKTMTSSH